MPSSAATVMRSSPRCEAHQRARARSPAAITKAILAVTLFLAACGSGDPPRPAVALLPTRGVSSHVWQWTAHCPLAPTARDGCARGGPTIGFAQLNADAWNLGGPPNAGSLDMSVESSGGVRIDGHFARTAPCTDSACIAPRAFTWVRGYPHVLYGINQCYAGTSPPPSPRLRLRAMTRIRCPSICRPARMVLPRFNSIVMRKAPRRWRRKSHRLALQQFTAYTSTRIQQSSDRTACPRLTRCWA